MEPVERYREVLVVLVVVVGIDLARIVDESLGIVPRLDTWASQLDGTVGRQQGRTEVGVQGDTVARLQVGTLLRLPAGM